MVSDTVDSASSLLLLLLAYTLIGLCTSSYQKSRTSGRYQADLLQGLVTAGLLLALGALWLQALAAGLVVALSFAGLRFCLATFANFVTLLLRLCLEKGLQLLIVIAVWLSVEDCWGMVPVWLKTWLTSDTLLLLLVYLLVFKPASVLIGCVLKPWQEKLGDEDNTLINGGAVIGYLERSLTLTFVLVGQWQIVGFLLTAKSILRFNELKGSNHQQRSEYVLLGTLLSFSISVALGLLVQLLLR